VRRKRLLVALGLLTGLVAFAGLSLTLTRKTAAEEKYDRLQVGMDDWEATAILGNTRHYESGRLGTRVDWRDMDSGEVVGFESYQGRVVSKEYSPGYRPGWWRSLRNRLGW
jgi:hypothetical protein